MPTVNVYYCSRACLPDGVEVEEQTEAEAAASVDGAVNDAELSMEESSSPLRETPGRKRLQDKAAARLAKQGVKMQRRVLQKDKG
eukprot:6176471-Pleurochrysis_carterae.AAC.2